MKDHLLALTTLGKEEDARRLAKALVERRLTACVNVIGPVRSVYRWKGTIEEDRELLLLIKTRKDRFEELERALAELHPYEVPELIALPIEHGATAYLRWLDESLTAEDQP
jgi:periplasmic divalent cation tolerance protein